jgi:hypothetical protein
MLLRKITLAVRNFIFPPFSELEVIALVYLLFHFFFEIRNEIYPYLLQLVITSWNNTSHPVWGKLIIILYGAMICYTIYLVITHAILNRTLKDHERGVFAFIFYLVLSVITLFSLSSIEPTDVHIIDIVIIWYLLIRSLLTILSMLILLRAERIHIVKNQLKDKQVTKVELLLLLLLSTVFYIYLRGEKDSMLAISIAYFYVTFIISVFRNSKTLFYHT